MESDFEALYRKLLPLARVVAPRGVDGSDLVEETLTRTLVRHPDLSGIRDPLAYLSAAVLNTARSWGTRTARRSQIEGAAPNVRSGPSDDDRAVEFLMRLPPRQRACLYLRFVEELAVADVAGSSGARRGRSSRKPQRRS